MWAMSVKFPVLQLYLDSNIDSDFFSSSFYISLVMSKDNLDAAGILNYWFLFFVFFN